MISISQWIWMGHSTKSIWLRPNWTRALWLIAPVDALTTMRRIGKAMKRGTLRRTSWITWKWKRTTHRSKVTSLDRNWSMGLLRNESYRGDRSKWVTNSRMRGSYSRETLWAPVSMWRAITKAIYSNKANRWRTISIRHSKRTKDLYEDEVYDDLIIRPRIKCFYFED